jgi:hypothetical protein
MRYCEIILKYIIVAEIQRMERSANRMRWT